jgi:cell wall-associated NlpC family hydrolase
MVDLKKFVGIPYGFNCETYESADCVGLVKLFYEEHGYNLSKYDRPTSEDWFVKDKFKVVKYLLKHFDKTRDIDNLSYGDLLVVEINGESHLFIYLGYDKVLTTYPKVSEYNGGVSFIDRFQKYWLKQPGVKFIAGFKRRCK